VGNENRIQLITDVYKSLMTAKPKKGAAQNIPDSKKQGKKSKSFKGKCVALEKGGSKKKKQQEGEEEEVKEETIPPAKEEMPE